MNRKKKKIVYILSIVLVCAVILGLSVLLVSCHHNASLPSAAQSAASVHSPSPSSVPPTGYPEGLGVGMDPQRVCEQLGPEALYYLFDRYGKERQRQLGIRFDTHRVPQADLPTGSFLTMGSSPFTGSLTHSTPQVVMCSIDVYSPLGPVELTFSKQSSGGWKITRMTLPEGMVTTPPSDNKQQG